MFKLAWLTYRRAYYSLCFLALGFLCLRLLEDNISKYEINSRGSPASSNHSGGSANTNIPTDESKYSGIEKQFARKRSSHGQMRPVPGHDATKSTNSVGNQDGRPNVLFLVADDLRPQLNSYKGLHNPNPFRNVRMHTPHLDALSRISLQLNSAYVQFGICNPSRASYMTSRRPDTTKVWDLRTFWRTTGNFTTIPQYFKHHGYRTQGMGKIYHPGRGGGQNDPLSWSEPYVHSEHTAFYQYTNASWWAVPASVSRFHPLPDEEMTDNAIAFLSKHASTARTGEEPFFLAVGYVKPHLPFVFPERYETYYPLDNIEVAMNSYPPLNFPKEGWFHVEANRYDDIRAYNVTEVFETLPETPAKLLRRAYFSCVSYIDDQIGRLLSALERLELQGNTMIVFLGDHGFHLGENGMWGKHTNLEKSTHAPLMIHIPGKTNPGRQSESLVEFVDLFPTLVDAAGLKPLPECPDHSVDVAVCTEGRSFIELVENPLTEFRSSVMSQMVRRAHTGYTLRTKRYRYVTWAPVRVVPIDGDRCRYDILFDSKDHVIQELYDHLHDPEENINLADNRYYANVVGDFNRQIRQKVVSNIVSHCNIMRGIKASRKSV